MKDILPKELVKKLQDKIPSFNKFKDKNNFNKLLKRFDNKK